MSELSDLYAVGRPWVDFVHLASDGTNKYSDLDGLRSRIATGAGAIADNIDSDTRNLRRLHFAGVVGAWIGLVCILAAVALILIDQAATALVAAVLGAISNVVIAVVTRPAARLRDDVLRTLPELRTTLALLALIDFVLVMPEGPAREVATKQLIKGLLNASGSTRPSTGPQSSNSEIEGESVR